MAEYAHPESLVSTEWVAEHGTDANVRLVEVDVDTSAYDQGHIAGAVGWDWHTQSVLTSDSGCAYSAMIPLSSL